jgi:GT2 family glycosyltransferase
MPMISVIIPHLNQVQALSRCLASLAAQEGVAEPVEIIVVDNGSTTSPTEICSSFANVALVFQKEAGPGPARNMGASTARGDILAFIDADCVAGKGWLAAIEHQFASDPDVTILGGDVRILYEDARHPTLLEAYESVFAYRMREYIRKKGFTGTGNLAVRADAFAAIGDFAGIEIAEDVEWGQRAGRLGYRIRYVPDMVAYHPARKTFAELARKWDRHIAHDFNQARSQRLWWPRWILKSAALAISPAAEVVRIGTSDRLTGFRSRTLALVGVTRIRLYRARVMLALGVGANASSLSSRWNRQ